MIQTIPEKKPLKKHSSSARRNLSFSVVEALQCSGCYNLRWWHFLAVELGTAHWFSIASGPSGCQVSCGIVPYGTASSNDIQQHT